MDPVAGSWQDQLLRQLRPAARDVDRLLRWLGGALGGTATLYDHRGAPVAGRPPADLAAGPGAGPRPDRFAELLADLGAGRLAAAAVDHAGRSFRLVAVRGRTAGAVLVLSRPDPFDRRAGEILTSATPVLELLLREQELAAEAARLAQLTAGLRLAILQLLMVADVSSARRAAGGLCPGLLDASTARVYVLEGPAAERETLAGECGAATAGRALVVRCPAVDQHLVIVVPDRAGAEAARAALHELVARRADVFLGGSGQHPLALTATAYGEAASALAVARFRPARSALYAHRAHPAEVLDPEPAGRWAAELLRPLDALPHHVGAELVATTRLGLEFTAVSAAQILGVSRNTVRARMDRVARLLGADLGRLGVRTVVQLALNLQADGAGRGSGPAGGPGSGGLARLLAGPAARAWARDLLGRLAADQRELRATLRGWLLADANTRRAAQVLGLHAQTVRDHLRSAEPLLERQLLAGGSDLYEVVLAHLVLGELELPA
ncbi:helix-turn-helix domain-containing protein [Kitasatospora sp. LaBMicrA B282]|uniref:helix-turn-helix domain-containing protein n=1 Tax=Kitasatospora sp. LaBMicrA B282 TaxID=3420949 RepID=UPI003D0B8BE5